MHLENENIRDLAGLQVQGSSHSDDELWHNFLKQETYNFASLDSGV